MIDQHSNFQQDNPLLFMFEMATCRMVYQARCPQTGLRVGKA
jgi:hypothetical protein